MAKEVSKEQAKKWRRIALAIGAIIGLSCAFMPPKYQAVCAVVSKLTASCGA